MVDCEANFPDATQSPAEDEAVSRDRVSEAAGRTVQIKCVPRTATRALHQDTGFDESGNMVGVGPGLEFDAQAPVEAHVDPALRSQGVETAAAPGMTTCESKTERTAMRAAILMAKQLEGL